MLVKRLRSEGANGVLGQPAFAAAMRTLSQSEPAYNAFDEAARLYADEDYDTALVSINSAIAQNNSEARFHGLRGAIRFQQKRYGDAITNFDRAVARDNNYFFYFLSRGLAYKQQNQSDRAQADLMQSIRLLPTPPAYRGLGEMAEARGDLERAKQFYEQAGQSPGAEGQAARYSLLRLELPTQPSKYIDTVVGRDERNRLVLRVRNRADAGISKIVVRVEYSTEEGVRSFYHQCA